MGFLSPAQDVKSSQTADHRARIEPKNKYWNCDDDCSDYDDSNDASIFESSVELDFHLAPRISRRDAIVSISFGLFIDPTYEAKAMGYNARNDEIRDNVTRMRREWEAQRNALAAVRRFNATLFAKGYVWFWPKIAAALTSKHHWLVINCDSCGTVVDLDLRVKPRDPEASIRVARDVQCPRCNGYGRPRVIALARGI